MSTWLNRPLDPQFRTIDGLSIRYAESEDRDDQALLLTPWPESLFAYEPTWLWLPILRDLLPQIQTPVQIEVGHFVWEDGADEYAALVTSWWSGGYATTGGSS